MHRHTNAPEVFFDLRMGKYEIDCPNCGRTSEGRLCPLGADWKCEVCQHTYYIPTNLHVSPI
jgi:ribosomal protein L37AE/L43A